MTGKQLKNSILQWAIQGKLVPQDPNDEPASVLLEKIRQEKERLIKEKKIKRDKNASFIFRGEDNSYYEKILATGEVKCIDEEIPFEIPQGWEWERLGNITTIKGGKRIPVGMTLTIENTGHKYIRVADMKNHSIKNDDIHYITDDIYELIKGYYISKEDLYITVAGTIGNVGVVPMEFDQANLTENADKIEIYSLCKLYLLYALLSDVVQEQVRECTTKVGQPKLAIIRIQQFLIPIAPLAEQRRISEKIEMLLPVVDRYDGLNSKLGKLNNTINGLLKKSILQEAIQGKLVPQIAEEGTARELLEQIRQEKQKLVEEGKLKKTALTDSIIYKGEDNRYYEKIDQQCKDITEEIPFEIPENWEWTRLSSIVRMTIGKTPPRGEQSYWNNGIYPWVSISDMYEGGITSETKEKVSEYAANNLFSAISPKGSLLMSFKLTVGRTTILGIDAYHNEAIITIFPYLSNDNIMKMYLFKLLPILSTNGDSKDAIKGKTLNSKSLANLLIPLPPLQEQQRIVAQIERLFEQLK